MKNQQGLLSSFRFAFKGVGKLFNERNARIHLAAAVLVVAMGAYFQISSQEWVMVIFAIGLVMAAEGFNTALENIVDLISPEIHEKAGNAKDLAAGSVLITSIAAAIIGLIIFLPRILELLNQ